MEARSLLTALVINPDTKAGYLNAAGGIEVDNFDMAGKDGLVIEGFTISPTSGNAITINLSGRTLKNLAIESIVVTQYSTLGFDIDLTNVTGLHTIAIEDVRLTGTRRALDLTVSNTTVDALTIDDSTIPGIKISSVNGANIAEALITESTVIAGAGVEGILLNVDSATADNFQIKDNLRISSPNRDFVRIDSADSPIEGLSIVDNQIGTVTQGSGLLFRADGDTFLQPLTLTNNSTQGELIQTFKLDLSAIGLQFDDNAITGKAFTPVGTTGTTTGFQNAVLSTDKKILTVTFATASSGQTFAPGDTLQFNIDIDLAGGTPASIFGDDLIGADVTATLTGNFVVAGQMIGDPAKTTASEFAVGPRATGNTQGISLNLANSPTTNLFVEGNTVAGTPGHAFLINATAFSDVTGTIKDNKFLGSGRDGINLSMVDSNFTGAIIGNNVSNNGGNGISLNPVASRSGLVQAVVDSNPVVVTSTNHGLVTGDRIILQGLVNDNPSINHPANGLHTITVITPNTFRVNSVSGLGTGVKYVGGGAWYVPDFQTDGSARGLVKIDMQATVPRGTIRAATNAGPIVITSPNHGLASGQRVRISNVAGNTAANGVQKITVLDANRFRLDGATGNGAYDTTGGFGTWQANVVTGATGSSSLVITSPGHGLKPGEEVRITGVLGNTAANGTFKVSVLSADTFLLVGATGNGTYGGGGNWVRLKEKTSTGDLLVQNISKNLVTGNLQTGIKVDLATGTVFDGDIIGNTVSQNLKKGIHVLSHSFGLGTDLPLNPADPLALPGLQDISFDVNIGTSSKGDENILDGNTQAGVVIEGLDHGTGSFRIQNNRITSSRNDKLASTPYQGDGIVVRLTDDVLPSEAVSFLSASVIDGNIIGVDNQGNEGHGVFFDIEQRTRLQDLEVTNNNFLNNSLDGFHFERSEDADLNAVVAEKNRVTNNLGDGFEFYAINTTKDRLDFRINENIISDNANYGMRLNVVADARLAVEFDRNQVTGNGTSTGTAANGFHPNDSVPGFVGNTKAEGGVGILAFQQADIVFTSEDSQIDNNVGDGFSADAFNFFDTLVLNATFTNTTFNGNTLTGLRNHGAAFGQIDIRDSEFNSNGEDGLRSISNIDKTDVFERRVGGMNIYLTSLNSQYILNGQSGMQLGQGVSAMLGDGTIGEANLFDQNGEDGLKITQSAGPYLAGKNIWTPQFVNPTLFQYVTRRHIEASTNFFRNNTGDGIDIGHFALTEGGNVEHGDEVITDVHVSIDNAEISGNEGDGIEYLADSTLRISPIVGGGQDVEYSNRSSLSVTDSRVVSNDKRGIDILNRRGEDSTVSIVNNEIVSNGFEGIYVLNTASDMQLQGSSSDPLVPYLETFSASRDDSQEYFSVGSGITRRIIHIEVSPNIELRVQDNRIESNGSVTQTSTVPINVTNNGNNASGVVNPDWTHQFRQVPGTLGGLVIRVGAADSVGQLQAADPEAELSLSGVDAEVYRNSFDGNIGADVYFDSFTSQIPAQSIGNLDGADDPDYRWDLGYRDPLSRFDLVFRENSGNSLDVINGFAFLDNHETEFKSRAFELTDAPNHGHNPPTPRGPFSHTYDRFRNQTRTLGFFNSVGQVPGSQFMNLVGLPSWSYDGWGTPTWRVESDFDFNNFTTSDQTQGFSDFYDVIAISLQLAEENNQWDTGRDVDGFNGETPYSLNRGDVFNVRSGQAPIAADSLENNDSFLSAHDLGKVAGSGYSVNSQATNNTLSIEKKGDRDYYRFTAAGSGALDLNLNATDAQGDRLYFMLYEVMPGQQSQEVPVPPLKNANGTANFVSVAAGASGNISATVVAGHEYIIEVMGNEAANLGSQFSTTSKPFVYGTARTYGLSIDAPAAPPGGASGSIASGAGSGAFSGGSVSGSTSPVESGGAGAGASGASIPGARPTAAFVAVSPDPRSTSAGGVTLNFTEDVNGVDIADFTLTRNGVNVPLTAGMMTRINASRYFFNLSTNTAAAGTYVLTLKASGSGILDSENLAMLANATETWVTTTAVNTVADTPDTNLGDRLSRDVNGRVSLRASVMESNQVPHLDEIQLGAGQYFLSQLGRFEDDAVTGDLDIKGSTTIRGVSAAATIILGADIDRIFHVFPRAVLTLENLTIRGGEAFDGGAIFNEGTVILRNVNVLDNEAFNQGGGIFNAPNAVLNVFGSSIDTNIAGSRGGGVNNLGSTTYLNTTIARNVSISRGGGIFNEGSATASLINVTLAGNTAASRGAGLASEGSRTSTLGNSIIEANVTVARIPVNGATINRDLMGVVISRGNNFIQVLDSRSTTATTAGLLNSDKFGRDAAPFATLTSALARGASNGVGYRPLIPGRAAVDGGSNSVYPSSNLLAQKDAIGNPRLIEGNSDGLITIDAGAVEHLVNTPVAIFTATPNPAAFGDRVSFDGRGSTHPNPAVGTIVLWEWDYDFNATNGFIPRLTGSTTSRIYPSSAKTNYEVRLRVTDNFGNFGFYSRNIIIGKPTTPVIDRPAAARPGVKPVTTDLTPTFRWTADPATYDLELFRITSTGKVPVFPLVSMTTKTYTPTTPLTMGEYELIVTSRNNTFSSPSAPYRFIVGGMSGLAPTGNTFDLTPKFQWGAVIGSKRYELKVRRVLPTVVEGVINEASISDTSFEPTTSLGLGKFEWQVRAYDIDEVAGAWSSVQTLTIGHIAMTTPGPVTVDTTPTFTWTNMDNGQGTTKYEFWLNRIGGQTKVIVESALTTTTYTPTTPIPNGTYDAWVRPLSPDGEGGLWSYTRRFVMDYRVGPVTYAPVGVSTDTTPTFRWQAADGASSYNLWVDNLSTGVQKTIFVTVPHQANAAQISYTPTVALTAGNYRWWVQTVAPSGLTTSYSAGTDFTVPVPSVISPRGSIATNLPLFRWSGVTGYVSYEIWVDNVTSGAKEVLRVKGITTTSYQSTLPLENGNFKVWIRGYDKDGNISQWSGPADFTVTVGVGVAPILTNSFSNTNGTRTFNWSAGTGAFSYEIIIKRISDPGQPVVLNQTGITGTTFTSPSSFTSGTYRWWIRGLDADGNGLPWSQPLQFFVQTIETVPADVSEIALAAATPVVFDASAGFWSDDVVRSITATPAGTVVQIDPMSVTPEPMTERSVVVEDISGIDDVMGEWASLNMADAGSQVVPVAVPMIKTSVVSVEKSEPENENRALDLLMAGMALGAVVSKVRKSKDQQ